MELIRPHAKPAKLECQAGPTSLSAPTPVEKKQLLVDWNNTRIDFPRHKNLAQLFYETSKQHPSKIALQSEGLSLSYRELNQAANYIANLLLQQNLSHESIIAICCERNSLAIVFILGVLKAGLSFLPIDIHYPRERITYLIQNSHASLLLTNSKLFFTEKNVTPLIPLLAIEKINFSKKLDRDVLIQPNQLAYVIYTSGSTGNPKGVMIEHRGVINVALAKQRQLRLNKESHILCFAAFGFDAMIWEVFSGLLSAATLVMTKKSAILPGKTLANTINQFNITHITLPPSTLANLTADTLPCLQYLTVGGEACPLNLMQHWAKKVNFFNAYGPTEITVCATMGQCFITDNTVTIGKPIANTKVYVLNGQRQLLAIGLVGELYIGGAGLARGYLHQPELTAKKFIDNPFNSEEKLYRTGDYVRWLPDGRLEFVGRIDEQVKIRGFRIETGEIETYLNQLPNVKQSAVVAKKNKDRQYLLAYLSTKNNINHFDLAALKNHLSSKLPAHMMPSGFILLNQLPLTPHDKIDKKLLSELEDDRLQTLIQQPYQPAQNQQEQKIICLFSELLGLPANRIGRDMSFFDLGGDSLTAIQLIAKINEKFNQQFTAQLVMIHQTCEKLAKLIVSDKKNIHHSQSLEILIPLRTSGTRRPIFLIHPIGGTVFMYQILLKYLPKDQPLYAIQDPGVNDLANADFLNVEAMCEHYLPFIKKIQPIGPYTIGGLSSGSNMACEIAERLKNNTEQKNTVLLFDGWARYPKALKEFKSLHSIVSNIYPKLMNELHQNHIQDFDHWLQLCWSRAKLMKKYQPKTYTNKLYLFKAQELLPVFQNNDADDNYWTDYTTEELTIFNTPGDHESIFYEPNAKTLAEQIITAVESTRQKN